MSRRLLWAALGMACLLAATSIASAAPGAPGARRSLAQAAAAPASPAAAAPVAPAPVAEGNACCQRLAAIGFSSNLPVVVLDTAGQPLVTKGLDVPIRMCTCNSGGCGVAWGIAWQAGPAAVAGLHALVRRHTAVPCLSLAACRCTRFAHPWRPFAGQPFEDYEGLASAAVRGTSEPGCCWLGALASHGGGGQSEHAPSLAFIAFAVPAAITATLACRPWCCSQRQCHQEELRHPAAAAGHQEQGGQQCRKRQQHWQGRWPEGPRVCFPGHAG